MKELKFKAIGITPLLIHNNRTANPLNRYAQILKILNAKGKNKTDQDHKDVARIEWEAGLYLHDGVVAIPGRCIDAMLFKSAKKTRNGPKYKEGTMIAEDYCQLDYRSPKIKIKENDHIPNPELDKFYDATNFQAPVKINRSSTVIRTRPIFYDWSLEFTVIIDENILDERTVKDIAKTAGEYVGLCEDRPRKGRFEIELI